MFNNNLDEFNINECKYYDIPLNISEDPNLLKINILLIKEFTFLE